MDASLFALFAYSTVLKKILFDPSGQEHEARRVLNSIVTTLQNGEVVSEQQTTELRQILKDETKRDDYVLGELMDADEFLEDLFSVLKLDPIIANQYVYQTYLNKERSLVTVQRLLKNSFRSDGFQLNQCPDIFITKMPVSAGKLKRCKGIIPNLTLDMAPLGCKGEKMILSAVICLKNAHFVAFTKMQEGRSKSAWRFHNASPCGRLFVETLQNFEDDIENALKMLKANKTKEEIKLPACDGFSLSEDTYICIYVKP